MATGARCNSSEIQSQDHLESRPTCGGVSRVGLERQDSRSSTPIYTGVHGSSVRVAYCIYYYIVFDIKYFMRRESHDDTVYARGRIDRRDRNVPASK